MEEVIRYKSKNGTIYENKEDCAHADAVFDLAEELDSGVFYRGVDSKEVAEYLLQNYTLKRKK